MYVSVVTNNKCIHMYKHTHCSGYSRQQTSHMRGQRTQLTFQPHSCTHYTCMKHQCMMSYESLATEAQWKLNGCQLLRDARVYRGFPIRMQSLPTLHPTSIYQCTFPASYRSGRPSLLSSCV